MKFFIDTEFIEDGSTIELLSIGAVAENGQMFYQCNRDAKLDKADEWVIWNVFPSLNVAHGSSWFWREEKSQFANNMGWRPEAKVVPRYEIRDRLVAFMGSEPEIWGYFADYDWVTVCQLFGRMVDLPKTWPRYCRDVKQLADSLGNPELPAQISTEHNALNDAVWVKEAYEFLVKLKPFL